MLDSEIVLRRAMDQLHFVGGAHWADNDGQGRANFVLAVLKLRNLLDPDAVIHNMRARGHDERSLTQLKKMIDSLDLLLTPGPRARVGPIR